MKSALIFTIVLSPFLMHQAEAQNAPVFKKNGVIIQAVLADSSHAATLSELNKADSIFDFNIAVATFPAGAKLDWHYHPGGQILVITDGTGYYQERGKPKQIVHKGDIIKCLPGVEHWHGTSVKEGVTYMATNPAKKGSTVWLQQVTDEEYRDSNSSDKK